MQEKKGSQTLFRSPRSGSGCAVGLDSLEKLESLEALQGTEPRLSGRAERVRDPEQKGSVTL